jgi:hypothetical protein
LRFSTTGLGRLYGSTFEAAIGSGRGEYPNVDRSKTMMVAADFGGEHKAQAFETYAFLFLDLEQNASWLRGQTVLRQGTTLGRRRMAFKDLGDSNRRSALVPFLQLADTICGILIVFAMSKGKASAFESDDPNSRSDLLRHWKPHIQEKLLRVLHISGLFRGALSIPDQEVLWVIDQDAIAANVTQLTELTQIFSRISSNYFSHDLGRLKCGTTLSDDGTLQLEDLVSIPDLAAGAVAELATALTTQQIFPRKGLITPSPTGMTWKSQLMASWLAQPGMTLRRFNIHDGAKSRPTRIALDPFEVTITLLELNVRFPVLKTWQLLTLSGLVKRQARTQ